MVASIRFRFRLLWVGLPVVVAGCDAVAPDEVLRSAGTPPSARPAEQPSLVKTHAGGDQTGPRIVSMVPAPGAWIVNNIGLAEARFVFDESVSVPPGAVAVWTVGGGDVTGFTPVYDDSTRTLTLTFAPRLRDDRVTLVIDYVVTDVAGNALDGEIVSASNAALPSGNGKRGGQAVFRINVLQGDANRDGSTDALDDAIITNLLGVCVGDPTYWTNADLNGDGCINILDLGIFRLAEGRSLPVTDGTPPVVYGSAPSTSDVLMADVQGITLTFNEPIAPLRFTGRTCFLLDVSGAIFVPDAAVLAPDGLSANYNFNPPLPQCTTYSLNVSNSLADPFGSLLSPPITTPIFSGVVVPVWPTVDPHPSMTNASSLQITGLAPGASLVEVIGPMEAATTMVKNDSYSFDVPLNDNSVNYLYFTAIGTCGGRSAPATALISHDGQPPNLFIDFPANAAEITNASTDVGGRVGDLLSGFMGLTVNLVINGDTMNPIPAIVDVGIGNNGTFAAMGVPLVTGANTIQATATDQLGNSVVKQITVNRVAIPPNTPLLQVVSGNGQAGTIHTLLPAPIVARVLRQDGMTPFANKVVTFNVTRSDGRLAAAPGGVCVTVDPMTLQCHTDANGEAGALWMLGGDAGCGNNRVEVTSMSIVGTTMFCASAAAAPPKQINVGSGNNQRVEVGGPAPEELRAWVSDGCNGVAGLPVTFTVVQGGGKVNGLDQVTVPTLVTGHAEVSFTLGPDPGNNAVEANFAGNTTSPARFVAYGVKRDLLQPTSFTGLVLDNSKQPVLGAKCTLVVGGSGLFAYTDANGQFRFDNVPGAGQADLVVDGRTATAIGGEAILPCMIAGGASLPNPCLLPFLHYEPVIVPNAVNTLPTPILLPKLDPANRVPYRGTACAELTVAGMDGLKMTVAAGTRVVLLNGSCVDPADPLCTGDPACNAEFGGPCVTLSLNQVHHDDVPMPIPDGAAPPFAWTLQPAATTFNPPVRINYPNMSFLPPGSIAYFLSFNHDTMRFEIVAGGHVTDDGSCIESDPGAGITKAGWGCNCPPYSVTGKVKNCCRVAVITFDGGPGTMQNANQPPNAFARIREILKTLTSPGPQTIFAKGVGQGSWNDQQMVASRWLTYAFEGCPCPPPLILLGYSAGGEAVRHWSSLEFPAALRMTLDPIDRDYAGFPGCTPYQRDYLPPWNSGSPIINFLATTTVADEANCAEIGDVPFVDCDLPLTNPDFFANCLLGHISPGEDIIVPETHHFNIPGACSVEQRIILEAVTLLDAQTKDPECQANRESHFLGGDHLPPRAALPIPQAPLPQSADLARNAPLGTSNLTLDSTFALFVGGQAVRPDDDGSFRISNISAPDLMGAAGPGSPPDFVSDRPVRVIGVRDQAAPSVYVYSSPFYLNQTLATIIDVDALVIADSPPILPVALSMTTAPGQPSVLEPGQDSQLQVTGNLPFGGQADFTSGSSGTVYYTTNPAIAGISADGLVSGQGRGLAFITAINESATATKRIDVATDTIQTTIEGFAQYANGNVAAGANVSTSIFGGSGTSDGDGFFAFSVTLPAQVTELTVVAELPGGVGGGSVSGVPAVASGISDAGIVIVEQTICDGQWAVATPDYFAYNPPCFNENECPVTAMIEFDPPGSEGMALYANGITNVESRVAKWDGASWSPVGGQFCVGSACLQHGRVYAFTAFDPPGALPLELYAGGYFSRIGGTTANGVARWNGSSWSAVGSGVNVGVNAATVYNNSLYVAGRFTTAGGVSANRIAKWNGTSWTALGSGPTNGVNGDVRALAVHDDGTGPQLFVAGDFTSAGTLSANRIAKWNGSSWSLVGSGPSNGTNGPIYGVQVFDDGSAPALYVSGNFTTAGGLSANQIAGWSGSAWFSLPAPPTQPPLYPSFGASTLASFDDGTGPSLFVAGGLGHASGNCFRFKLGKWNGKSWEFLDPVFGDEVDCLSDPGNGGDPLVSIWRMMLHDDGSGPALWVGGSFSHAGDVTVSNIAKWFRPQKPCP